MHHHYCWGQVHKIDNRVDYVDPGVAVVHHYKRCHFGSDECRRMMNDTRTDDTVMKYRTELVRAVSRKLGVFMLK